MILTLHLTPEQEKRLEREAALKGVAPENVIGQLIDDYLPAKPMSGTEALAYWERTGALGVFADRPEDSPELARKFRKQGETRDWTGE